MHTAGVLGDLGGYNPQSPAVILPRQVVTYAQLEDDVAALVHWLAAQGLGSGQRVGVQMADYYWNWVGHLAALRLGLAVMTTRLPHLQVALACGRLDAIIAAQAKPEGFAGTRWLCPDVAALDHANKQAFDPATTAQAKRLAMTTGTTGTPRLTVWDMDILYRRVAQVRDELSLNTDTVLHALSPLETTGGFRYPLATWLAGGCVLMGEVLPDGKVTMPATPPSTLVLASPSSLQKELYKNPGEWPAQNKRHIVLGGGRVPAGLRQEALARACGSLATTYGATETGSIATGDTSLIDRHPGAAGFLRSGVVAEIVDEDDRPVPAGQAGILRVKTSYMVAGYEDAGALSGAGVFRDGWFYPGDEAFLDKDGFLAILGRVSDIINIGGSKIAVADIESRLDGLSGIQDFCVLVMNLQDHDRLAVVVACETGVDLEDLQRRIEKCLSAGMVFSLIKVKEIPRNTMGKVARRKLAEKISARYAARQRTNTA